MGAIGLRNNRDGHNGNYGSVIGGGVRTGNLYNCQNNKLNNDGYELRESIEFYFQQRFSTIIELSSGQFLPGPGPSFFSEDQYSLKILNNQLIQHKKVVVVVIKTVNDNVNVNANLKNENINNLNSNLNSNLNIIFGENSHRERRGSRHDNLDLICC